MGKRAVIYARVSGDDVREGKEGRNLAEQVKMGKEYAEGKGYTIVAELSEDDRGASGAVWTCPNSTGFFPWHKPESLTFWLCVKWTG